jgi:hypothetical protein
LEYRGTEPLYALINAETLIAEDVHFGDTVCYLKNLTNPKKYDKISLESSKDIVYYTVAYNNLSIENYITPTKVYLTTEVKVDGDSGEAINPTPYYVYKINYGSTAGYRLTDLTYAGDLIANIGESLTSVLDKIKNMLGEFEYFYDLDGHFVF